ncbi:FtsX-like permease family protein [Streptococcus gallolyticus]|uniref:FtsX-like permease family protein n=1 Tax=Streptococcus gallolyticus TaxID=315405 RepID=UPI0020969350|nr:FtsX-like permease family protein [Streptococcus gallolyticus]MCO7177959.1 FtsX-like permease family protein [Streptococcus gallolyticus]MCY7165621.1 FtsX-like permease family protein [Streptococcus gallolyticus subsp. gallolyticus]MCY7182719.1 FtsX-like permease family protein [Streptococcus gallolyticus subsp. gallolyticus]
MAKKTYWKDIRKSFGSSKGRFLSIMLLMMLGAFAFVGLKVTGPDMQATASQYLKKHNTMDLSVIASYGFSDDDKEELDSIKNADVEYGYLTDVTVKNTDDAIRVFSKSTSISTYELVSGRLPKSSDEIALASTMKDDYKVGDTISFTQSDEDGILKNTTYKVVGFVNSSEILSTTSLGSSTAGDGSLSNYAVVTESAFDTDTYTIARIRYDDLKTLNPFSESYKQKVADKQDELDDLLSDNAEQRLASLKSDAQAEVDANQEKVDSAKAQLAAQESALTSLSAEQQAAAQSSIDQAQAEITESESEIQEAQAKIDAMTEPTYTSYTRSTLPGGEGYQTYESSTSSISSIGNIFPVVLYVVAALVTFTTMTRFVDEERTNSGILKALGYSNSDVIKKFVIYGFVASMIGTVLGIVAGHYLLSRIIAQIVTSDTTLGETHLYFYWNYTAIALVLALISAVLPAFLIAKNELSEKPAQLLLPKPPVKGSKIFLERIGVIWRRLSFTHKVTARNIFRYKQRMLMTIFGVAGSVALLFAGLGIRSSLGNVIENQFTNLMPYDMIVVKNDDNSSSENQEVRDFMDSNKVSQYQSIYFTTLSETISGLTDKQTVSIMVSSGDDFGDFIHLKDASSGDSLTLSDDGIIISEKLASLYHVEAGDSFTLKDSDGKKHTVKVAAVAEMNVGHYLFMSQNVYQKIFGETPNDNAYLVTLKNDSSSNIEKLSTKLLAMSGVSAVSQNSSLVKTVKSVVASLNGAMTILIVVSILLAVVILYNLTNINVAERIRELSTIKVLGFYDKEVTMYIYRETISLSLIGIIVGLIGGKYLHQVIMGMIGSDSIMFGTTVGWDIYVIPIAVIVIILLALGWLVNHILKTVDMLEALKSVD